MSGWADAVFDFARRTALDYMDPLLESQSRPTFAALKCTFGSLSNLFLKLDNGFLHDRRISHDLASLFYANFLLCRGSSNLHSDKGSRVTLARNALGCDVGVNCGRVVLPYGVSPAVRCSKSEHMLERWKKRKNSRYELWRQQ